MAMNSHKRRAEDDLQNEQRLAKRFDLLNIGKYNSCPLKIESWLMHIDHTGKLYIPVQEAKLKRTPRTNGTPDSMQIDDTKDRVYIHNLDDEISDIESEEEKMVFLPDIEKKLGKIPKSVLLGEGYPHSGNEMILYRVPTSLTVPEEQDNVRKAIIESRARAREKQMHDAIAEQNVQGVQANGCEPERRSNGVRNMGHVPAEEVIDIGEDEDAMDLG